MTYVNFGKAKDKDGNLAPVAYRVLDKNTTDFTGTASPTMFLDSDRVLNSYWCNDDDEGGGIYFYDHDGKDLEESELRKNPTDTNWSKGNESCHKSSVSEILADRASWTDLLDGYALSDGVYKAIAGSMKDKNEMDLSQWKIENINDNSLNDEKLFCLSYDEVKNYYGYEPGDQFSNDFLYMGKTAMNETSDKIPWWWLRSGFAFDENGYAGIVKDSLYNNCHVGYFNVGSNFGVSPALNLNLASVLFTSTYTDVPNFGATVSDTDWGKKNTEAWTLGLKTTDTNITVSDATISKTNYSFKATCTDAAYTNIGAVVTDSTGTVTKFGKVTPTDGVYKISTEDGEKLQVFAYDNDKTDATIHCTTLAEVEETPTPTPTPTPVTTTYTITATATAGGTITPSGTVKVDKGKNKSFTATPDEGYTLEKFVVDGKDEYINGNTYTFEKVNAKHTIQAMFTKKEEPQPEPEKFTGWKETNGKWQYIVEDKVLTGWQNNIKGWEGQWFYFDKDGIMQVGWYNNIPGWGDKWFYFDRKTGVMQRGWVFVDDGHGDFTNKLWYYLDTTTGVMHTDWQKIDGKWYYLDYNRNHWGGAMQTGWQWIPYSGGQAWFCFENNGAMYENTTTPDGYTVDDNGVWTK